jgi:hypothetical protein
VNADALANRGRTYADPNAASFRIQWDWNRREPRNRNEALKMLRAAYQDEVPYRDPRGARQHRRGRDAQVPRDVPAVHRQPDRR